VLNVLLAVVGRPQLFPLLFLVPPPLWFILALLVFIILLAVVGRPWLFPLLFLPPPALWLILAPLAFIVLLVVVGRPLTQSFPLLVLPFPLWLTVIVLPLVLKPTDRTVRMTYMVLPPPPCSFSCTLGGGCPP
jgi:hypothetical protein